MDNEVIENYREHLTKSQDELKIVQERSRTQEDNYQKDIKELHGQIKKSRDLSGRINTIQNDVDKVQNKNKSAITEHKKRIEKLHRKCELKETENKGRKIDAAKILQENEATANSNKSKIVELANKLKAIKADVEKDTAELKTLKTEAVCELMDSFLIRNRE